MGYPTQGQIAEAIAEVKFLVSEQNKILLEIKQRLENNEKSMDDLEIRFRRLFGRED